MLDLSSVRTHRRASFVSNIGPLLSKSYSTTSTNECGYTLHARVTSTGPSLASKDHSWEQSVISCNTILKRGYYHPQVSDIVSIFNRTWPISYWRFISIPSSMTLLSSLPLSWEDPYHQLAPPFSTEGSYL